MSAGNKSVNMIGPGTERRDFTCSQSFVAAKKFDLLEVDTMMVPRLGQEREKPRWEAQSDHLRKNNVPWLGLR